MKKNIYVPAEYLTKLWRMIIEFNMLQDGDRILVGLSGGKDSMFLTAALAEIKKYAPVKFELACYTMNAMFDNNFPLKELQDFCARYGLKHYSDDVNIPELWQNKGNTPCYSCAYFRRAATNRRAKELGFNKVAWAHHHDDAVETFFLNLLSTGQLKTFLPVTYLSKTDLTLIRPLLYYRESEVEEIVEKLQLHPLKNPCKYDGFTNRQNVKELIPRLEKDFPQLYFHLAAAMRQESTEELWPPAPPNKERIKMFRKFWAQKKNLQEQPKKPEKQPQAELP